MKKIISQISLILLMIVIGITSVFVGEVNAASMASLNVSSATEGGTFTVSLNLPNANIAGVNCNIEIEYSNGTKTNVGTDGKTGIAYTGGLGTTSITFSAKVAGTTKIRATNIVLADAEGNLLEDGGSTETTITIAAKVQEPVTPPTTTPSTPSTPSTSTPSTPVQDTNDGSSNNKPTDKKEDDKKKEEKEKEPEVVNPTFTDVNETVYAVNGCYVRSSCTTEINSNKIGGLTKGQSVKRTGIESTWSRIEYNGKTAYVATRLLTTEEPVDEKENTVNNTVTNELVDNAISNNVIENNVVEENIVSEQEMLNEIENQIGVLPEVGHNLATILFTIISVVSLIVIMSLKYKSRK